MRSFIKVLILLVVGFTVGSAAAINRGAVVPTLGEAGSRSPYVQPGDSVYTIADQGGSCGACALPDLSGLAAELRTAVVGISSENKSKGERRGFHGNAPDGPGGGGDQREFWEPFERFFGPMPRRQQPRRSMGSGFIFDPDGYILTNNHVVESSETITVKTAEGEEHEATLIGRDPKTDIAVLKIEGEEPFPFIAFGDSDELKVGEWVMAIGNPFGLDFTVTAGIVSAKGRYIGQGNYDDFIQTDAAINPGNSGGPLLDLEGRVVGINTSIFSRSGGNIGIGFAIPINLARELIPQLRQSGKVVRGWMGVMIQKVTPDIAESLDLEKPRGALVADVVDGGPAALAGIEVGDVIIEFGGDPVGESTELPLMVARKPIGTTVEVVVVRDGEEKTIDLEIAEMEEEPAQVAQEASQAYGLTVQNLTPEIAESLGLDEGATGVLVSGVEPGSPAAEAGLRRGDVIQELDRKQVDNVEKYLELLAKHREDKSLLLLVRRGETTVFLAIKPPRD
jgi:serine protease Do